MGRSAEVAGAVTATAAAGMASAVVKETKSPAAGPGERGENGPAAGARPPPPPPGLAARRLDAACAAIFRTKLLRQFAALMYKNR